MSSQDDCDRGSSDEAGSLDEVHGDPMRPAQERQEDVKASSGWCLYQAKDARVMGGGYLCG